MTIILTGQADGRPERAAPPALMAGRGEAGATMSPGGEARTVPAFAGALKAATRPAHRSIEAHVPLMSGEMDLAFYVAYLAHVHGFHHALERRIGEYHGDVLDAMKIASRVRLLSADLARLGKSRLAEPDADAVVLPACATPDQLLGIMYVFEGSALGGRIILSHLGRTIGISREHGGSYLDPYGEERMSRWAAFLGVLCAAGMESGRGEVIIASALETFTAFEAWLRRLALRGDCLAPAGVRSASGVPA